MKTNSQTQAKAGQSLGSLLQRVAMPVLLFSVVLLGFLSFSWYLILPMLTTVEVAGERRDTMELKRYVADLEASVLTMEEARRQLITPLRSGLYGEVKEEKYTQYNFITVSEQIKEVAKITNPKDTEAIVIAGTQFVSGEEDKVIVTGDVRNVGPRSMTILAQFVDALKKLDHVRDVETPKFTRELNGNIGYHSPFSFSVVLQ